VFSSSSKASQSDLHAGWVPYDTGGSLSMSRRPVLQSLDFCTFNIVQWTQVPLM
jgi:hypothetical protein